MIENKGFTLIELVMVIVLLGIIAAVAIPRMVDVTSTTCISFSDKMRADIRYAQNLAMTQNQRIRVAIISPNSYNITISSSGIPVIDRATSRAYPYTLSAGITFGAATFNSYLEFDAMGVPYESTGVITVARTLSILANGSSCQTITITPQTGAVN